MPSEIFGSILTTTTTTSELPIGSFLLCTFCSLILGALVALIHAFRNTYNKGFLITLALLPAIIQMVIMLVNGNLGTGVAVMGAFSLVRFRSVPGGAKEIASIFLAMAIGLATGMGYLGIAAIFLLVIGLANTSYTVTGFGEQKKGEKGLKITIPEGLDYTEVFDDLFKKYTSKWELVQVKTASMGSLYKLNYSITLKDVTKEKVFIDELRCRNGNLEIACGRLAVIKEEL